MAECPRCEQPVAEGATSCSCGWKARAKREPKTEKPRPIVHCAHETCDLPAICRVKARTGWAAFCEPHYVRYHDDLARKSCTEKGLDKQPNESSAEYRARMLAYMREHAKLRTFDDATRLEDEWAA